MIFPDHQKHLKQRAKLYSKNGFTLIEMITVVAIISLATSWAFPQFRSAIEQSKVDRYTQNLESGLFNLKTRLQKSSKKCTFFSNIPSSSLNKYINPSELLELGKKNDTNKAKYLDCIIDDRDIGMEGEIPFRFLLREGTSDKDYVEISTSETNYNLNNLGTSSTGKDITFKIRSKKWSEEKRLSTRCIVFSGNGHLYKGTWSYTDSSCHEYCPENQNCNRED